MSNDSKNGQSGNSGGSNSQGSSSSQSTPVSQPAETTAPVWPEMVVVKKSDDGPKGGSTRD